MYPFANSGYQLAHEVTPSVILSKCISKSFFPFSWLPESVSFSTSDTWRRKRLNPHTQYLHFFKYLKKKNGFLRCVNKLTDSTDFYKSPFSFNPINSLQKESSLYLYLIESGDNKIRRLNIFKLTKRLKCPERTCC